MTVFRSIGDLARGDYLTVGRMRRDGKVWRVRWVYFWERVERILWFRAWRSWVRPHLRPRTYAKERVRSWRHSQLPHEIVAYIWESDEGGPEGDTYWLGHLGTDDGSWDLCCFQADDEAEIRLQIIRILDHWKEWGGVEWPYHEYTLEWRNRRPAGEERDRWRDATRERTEEYKRVHLPTDSEEDHDGREQ